MRFAIFILILLNSALGDDLDKIKEYKKKVEENQRNIAVILVFNSFSALIENGIDGHESEEITTFFNSTDFNIETLARPLNDLIFSTKLNQEKVNEIATLLVKLRRMKYKMIGVGSTIKAANTYYLRRVQKVDSVCSKESYTASMSSIESFQFEAIDTSVLSKKYGINFGMSIDADQGKGDTPPDNSNTEDEQAVKYTLHALANIAPPPYNFAIMAVIELIAEGYALSQHRDYMKKLSRENHKLYNQLRTEDNIEKYYYDYCNSLKRAVEKVSPLLDDADSNRETIRALLDEAAAKIGSNLTLENINSEVYSKNTEQFYYFFVFQLLNQGMMISELNNYFSDNWDEFIKSYYEQFDNIEKTIMQLLSKKYHNSFASLKLKFESHVNYVDRVNYLKTEFTRLYLAYFKASKVNRTLLLENARILLLSYKTVYSDFEADEKALIDEYILALEKMEVLDEN